MPQIVVLYRSSDATAVARLIVERLTARYGDTLRAVSGDGGNAGGADVAGPVWCHALVVIVGPRWLGPIIDGRSAIQHPSDWVRNRIETALGNGVAIVPVVVAGSRAPRPAELPDSLREFGSRPAVEVDTVRDFSRDMDRLIETIDGHLSVVPEPRASTAPIPVAQPAMVAAQPDTVSTNAAAHAATASRGQIAGPAAIPAAAPAISSGVAGGPPPDRASAEYWLHHAGNERRLSQGDLPLITVSYASEDIGWVEELQAFIDPRIEQLQDPRAGKYELWQFSDAKRGTAPGDEFPTIVAEKMWRCRVALVLLSKSYFSSRYCRQIELPFLMWRREHHGLLCMPLRLGALPVDRVRLPAFTAPSRAVYIDDLIDDRQAPANFAATPHRDLTLKQLKELGYESEIETRFDGVARLVVDFLKKQHAAIDD